MINKKILILFVFLLIIFEIFLISSSENEDKIDSHVYESLKEDYEAKVIIEIKNISSEIEKRDIKKDIEEKIDDKIKHDFGDEIAVEVSKEELIELKNNPNVESIKLDKPIRAFLTDSVPLINASAVWPIKINNFNITGIDETICIIDTGINFAHSDLIGKNKTCIIDCVGKACVENCLIADDNGHGTHVAGIVAANGVAKGVAVGANLIGVKALNSAGEGSSSDIDAGIDWCIANANAYNISVISMSLGTDCDLTPQYCYNVYCDYDWTSTGIKIDNATSKNISVIIATGNDGKTINISAPACIKNATAVAATNKDDTIASYSNRNSLVDFIAPGTSISSTSSSEGYITYSGTSMAVPHVAGAFALIREFFRLQYNRKPTSFEILKLLNSTGKWINDTSGNGLNYSRVNVYSALISNDSSAPSVNLITPTNGTTQFNTSVNLRCNANDVLLSNLSLYVWNSTNNVVNITNHTTIGINADEQFILNLSYGDYKWNCLAYDSKSKSSFAVSNLSLTISGLRVNLIFPSNNIYTNQNRTFNCSAETESSKALSNITFNVWNSSMNLIFNSTKNISGISNSTLFYYNFTNETSYYWNCRISDNNSDSVFGESNFTIVYDITKPDIGIISPADSSSYSSNSQSIDFNYNVSDNYNIANCSLIVNNVASLTNSSINNLSLTQIFTQSFSPGNYNWSINCTDFSGNSENSTNRSFSIITPPAQVVTASGGGGGGGSPSTLYKTYNPNISETSVGYTKELSKNDKIQFSFFDSNSIKHTLTINEIKADSVNITIKSNPLNFLLGIGQSIKLNLSSADYYDLYIKLDLIENNKAKITIQTIQEQIPKIKQQPEISGNNIKETEKQSEENIDYLNKQIKIIKIFFFSVVIIFIIVIALILLIKRKQNKNKKSKIKEYKDVFNNHLKPRK
ncbi:S8 family serine peptidase [Candidatus Pacearchaeota archaeon]|nr:S8 family serine peptidase [Candidatus Pacearchaeota archaeon]